MKFKSELIDKTGIFIWFRLKQTRIFWNVAYTSLLGLTIATGYLAKVAFSYYQNKYSNYNAVKKNRA